MSDTKLRNESQTKKSEIKELTLEDLKRVRGGDGEYTCDDYNRDKCTTKDTAFEEQM